MLSAGHRAAPVADGRTQSAPGQDRFSRRPMGWRRPGLRRRSRTGLTQSAQRPLSQISHGIVRFEWRHRPLQRPSRTGARRARRAHRAKTLAAPSTSTSDIRACSVGRGRAHREKRTSSRSDLLALCPLQWRHFITTLFANDTCVPCGKLFTMRFTPPTIVVAPKFNKRPSG